MEISSSDYKEIKIHPNLIKERDALDFDKRQLSLFIWDGEEGLKKHLEMRKIFANDPILKNSFEWFEMNKEEKMEYMYKKLYRM